jgi:ABC-type nitrate/sulfonate/bicarbonate transport system ATPase subunit/GNAT superfamily N-acetyltransferase
MSLEIRHLSVGYRDHLVIEDLSLSVSTAEILALLGPSGCGKSTLLRAIAGLIPIHSGEICADGRLLNSVPTHLRRIAMVFQDEHLFPHRDVAANIEFGLKMAKVPSSERKQRVAEMLDLVGLSHLGSRRINELSGGEAKRVALARALAPAPDLLLLDEPLTGLDTALHERLVREVPAILRGLGTTAIWVTHNRAEAAAVADRIWEMGSAPQDRSDPAPDTAYTVVELAASETRDLRRSVLRVGTPSQEVVFPEDGEPTTWHLGLRDAVTTQLVAVSTWLPREHPSAPGRPGVQLRGMAVASHVQGTGLGAQLLEAGCILASQRGAQVLWARARDTALGFYQRAGWQVIGDGYIDATTALPHHDVVHHISDDLNDPPQGR